MLIQLKQVVKTYQTPAGPFTALNNVNLQVNAGEFAAVIGKSGSGKSTLINMVTGIDRPTLGEVFVGGTPIHNLNEDRMAAWRGRKLGVIFQFFQLLPTLTLLENVMLPMEFCNSYPRSERRERAMHLLEQVGLADQALKFPSAVSGGQQQRVAIARSLANDPSILVADEPTGSLDSKTADSIFMLFENFVRQGRTILMVTHDRDLASRVSRVILITDGEITDQYVTSALPLLNKNEQVKLLANLETVRFAPGATIFKQGDPADYFYIIVKGKADVIVHHSSGKDIVVNHLEAGHFFGEMGITEGGQRTASVCVTSDNELLAMQLDRDAFNSLLKNSSLTRQQVAVLIRQRTIDISLTSMGIKEAPSAAPARMAASAASETALIDKLTTVQDEFKTEVFSPGETIFQDDQPVSGQYIVTKGCLEIFETVQNGERLVRTMRIGEYLNGQDPILHARPSVQVRGGRESGVELVFIDQLTMNKMLAQNASAESITVVAMRRSKNTPAGG